MDNSNSSEFRRCRSRGMFLGVTSPLNQIWHFIDLTMPARFL